MNILPINIAQSSWYQLSSSNRTIIGTKVLEFVQDRWVEIKLISHDDKQRVYEYILLDQNMDGTALIHEWAADMEWFQSPVQVITDLEGKFIGINNFSAIVSRWQNGYRQKIAQKYGNHEGIEVMLSETDRLLQDPKRFLQSFMGYSHYRCFFQAFYKNRQADESSSLVLKNFFGTADLPLVIYTHNQQQGNEVTITNEAELDEEKFDRPVLVRMLKDLTNTYNLKVDLQTEMEEIYKFKNNMLQEADLFLQLHVPSFYTVVTAHQCRRIEQHQLPREPVGKNSAMHI
ncbi:hypothetical protein [Mucilaginibacter celer]|uniref:Uncharacterized protein n=1 Tax=Mucilaginibacter celer TaxID=2305508 RepID=A0A494VMR8_9SPHI|nr:hypothetical protein [Mucilaginibacter celer]AYL94971.1 hypothetical protein HYN43_006520 [Mucilaginibacter celer]